MSSAESNTLFAGLFAVSEAARLFDDKARVDAMLQVEAGLAQVQARLGMIPTDAAANISACCRTERFDFELLATGLTSSGNLAIPLVQQLTALVRTQSVRAAGFVHWGATSQDILDTGLVLQLRHAIHAADAALDRLTAKLAVLSREHAKTLMVGRTWMQHAVPITFGLKTAGWLSSLLRERERLAQMETRSLTLQFGGAAGTLASLGDRGLQVANALAKELGLAAPELPWHGARDRMAEVATVFAILSGTLSKIARDLGLLMQTEIAELAECAQPGRGGSSTMPHKRNPVGVAAVLACTQRVPGLVAAMLASMSQENERGLGGWAVEWETLPQLCVLTLSALTHLEQILSGLEVFPARMRRNLDLTHGLLLAEAVSMRLAVILGREEAHRLLQRAAGQAIATGQTLYAITAADQKITQHLSVEDLQSLFDPANYLGETDTMIGRVLEHHATSRRREGEQ